MGGVCSARKSKHYKTQQQQELNITGHPYIEVQSVPQSQPQSRPPEQKQEKASHIKDLLILYKKFTDMLGLIGNLDSLPSHTRDRLNACVVERSNINIKITASVRRIMKDKSILKGVEESDYYLLHNDVNFVKTFSQSMEKVSTIILTELQEDQDFELAFPILIVSFKEIALEIQKILETIKNVKFTTSLRKESNIPILSVESGYQKTTKKPTLYQ